MAIPTGYTYETFTQWITEEIFFEDTVGLGLGDLRSASSTASYKELYFLGTGYERSTPGTLLGPPFVPNVWTADNPVWEYRLYTRPIPFEFEVGDTITLENGMVMVVDVASIYNDEHLDVHFTTVPDGADIHEGLRYSKFTGEAVDRIPNPVFNAILGQVLGKMGLTDISEINLSNMYEFRQRAILETLKIIMENNTSFYPVTNAADGSVYYGGTLANQLLTLYRVEEAGLQTYLDYLSRAGGTPLNILEEGLSSESGVKVVW